MAHSEDAGGATVTGLFRELLEEPEPARPEVLTRVREDGRRMRRKRRLQVGAGAGALLGLAAAAAVVLPSPPSEHPGYVVGPAGGDTSASAAATASSSPDPLGPGALGTLHDRLLSALGAHLPAGFTGVGNGDGPTGFRLTRSDGGTVRVAALMGNPLPAGTRPASPCEPDPGTGRTYGTDCRFRTLADGSTGWLSAVPAGLVTQFQIATPQGKIIGLTSLGNDSSPGGGPLTLDELEALTSAPQVLAALEGVPLDAPG